MVVDTSALLAILQDEPERRRFNEAIEEADSRVMSLATFVEVSIGMEFPATARKASITRTCLSSGQESSPPR